MSSCGGAANQQQTNEQNRKINRFLKSVKNKIVVMSGKGGVGKSTVSANLAVFLSQQGYKVGLLDVDVHGPSIAGLLGLTGRKLMVRDYKIQPLTYTENLKVVTVQGLLERADDPIIWRGSAKIGIIRQFLSEVDWGPLDFLIIDSPPGTGDEPLTVAQIVTGCLAVIVTTPQEIALADVRKSINFCQLMHIPVLGVVENMSGFFCPTCNSLHPIFKSGGGEKMAADWGIAFLGQLPIDPSVVMAGDEGRAMDSLSGRTKEQMQQIVERMLAQLSKIPKEIRKYGQKHE